jgi:hypothetical protein
LLVAALIAVMETLKKNPYGLNLLTSSSADIKITLLWVTMERAYCNLQSYTETVAGIRNDN